MVTLHAVFQEASLTVALQTGWHSVLLFLSFSVETLPRGTGTYVTLRALVCCGQDFQGGVTKGIALLMEGSDC